MKWPRWTPANRDVTAWEVEVEQKEDIGDSLHLSFPKGKPRHGRRIIALNSCSSVERITLWAISNLEMIYTRNEPIWDRLLCSGMHNLFVMRDSDDQLEALIGMFFYFQVPGFWHSRNPEKKRIMILCCRDGVQERGRNGGG